MFWLALAAITASACSGSGSNRGGGCALLGVFPERAAITGGNTVVITGTNLDVSPPPAVEFGAGNPSPSVVAVDSTRLEVEVPPAAALGLVDLVVQNQKSGCVLPNGFEYVELKSCWSSTGDDQADAHFGRAVASAGDVNGDGFDDIVVGAFLYDTASADAGKAYLYYGGPSGVASTPGWTSVGDDVAGAWFGGSIASAGDVDGDGFSDVIVGACYQTTSSTGEGRAFLYRGGAMGLATTPTWTSSGDDQAGASYGFSVASAGDVNGDSFADVLVSAFTYDAPAVSAGKAYLYLGGLSGPSVTEDWSSVGEGQADARYGRSVASAGDVNGDGFSDIVVSAFLYDSPNVDAGKVYLHHGQAGGPSASPDWTSVGDDQVEAWYGGDVACAGDVDGDGFSDVIVGAYGFDGVGTADGKTYLYLGSPAGLATSPAWTSLGDGQMGAGFGSAVSSAGDLNQDGYGDVLVGALWQSTSFWHAGKAFLYLGGPGGLSASPFWTSMGDDTLEATFGKFLDDAGDVDGDGLPEILVSAPDQDSTQARAGKAHLYCLRP
jgi:hypothetical protein